MLIQAQPLPQITVDEMLGEASAHENNEVHVRGVVKPQSISENGNTFILAGVEEEVFVDATGIAVPEGLMEGTTIAVEGNSEPMRRLGDRGYSGPNRLSLKV